MDISPVRWLRAQVFRVRIAREIADEVQFHMEMRIAEYVRQGMSPGDARRAARGRFGNVSDIVDACRMVRHLPPQPRHSTFMNTIWQDLRYAARTFSRQPAFTFVSVLTLALGIGANAAIFSAVHTIILNPWPFPDGERLAFVWMTQEDQSIMLTPDLQDVEAWQQGATHLDGIVGFASEETVLTGQGEPTPITGRLISHEFMPFLGLAPVVGRSFNADDLASGERVTMLGEDFWRTRFGGASDVVGRSIRLNDDPHTIVGVMPRRANRLMRSDNDGVWVPLRLTEPRSTVNAIVRLPKQVPDSVVLEQLADLRSGLTLSDDERTWHPGLVRPNQLLGSDLRVGLWMLFGTVGFVLLIACVNVANMLLARGVGRGPEIAVRTALGAGRRRVARQLLTESLLLAIVGAAVGTALAFGAIDLLQRNVPANLDELRDVSIAPVSLAFTLAASIVSGLLFGMAPTLQVRSISVTHVLNQGGRTGSSASRMRLGQALVALEVAVALVLAIGATLMATSFIKLQSRDPGFDADALAQMSLELPRERYPDRATAEPFFADLASRVAQLPGVQSVAIAGSAPPRFGITVGALEVDGSEANVPDVPFLFSNRVSPEYFSVVGTRIIAGAGFPRGGGADNMAVVNESFARAFWPGGPAVGKRFRFDGDQWFDVVGVAADFVTRVRSSPDDFQVYFPLSTARRLQRATVIARTSGDPAPLIPLMKGQVWSVDPNLAVRNAVVTTRVIADGIAGPRFNTLLLLGFAALALILTLVGVYGVIALAVQQRTREIGIRVALGAHTHNVARLVGGFAMKSVGPGIALGVIASLGLTRFVQTLLYEVEATDPLLYGIVIVLIAATSAVAVALPARRAMRVDPVVALRE